MADTDDRQNNWLQVVAIIIGLVIHGSVIGYQLGKLTQLVESVEMRIVETTGLANANRDVMVAHLTKNYPDLEKRVSLLERESLRR